MAWDAAILAACASSWTGVKSSGGEGSSCAAGEGTSLDYSTYAKASVDKSTYAKVPADKSTSSRAI